MHREQVLAELENGVDLEEDDDLRDDEDREREGCRSLTVPTVELEISGGSARRGLLLSHIRNHVLESGKRIRKPDQCFHPSELGRSFCPRSWALLNYHPDGPDIKARAVDLDTARAFARGNEIHERTLGAFHRTGALWGRYVHLRSRREHLGFAPEGRGWSYKEVPLRHDEDRIVGRADGLIRLDGKKYGVEIKPISDYGYAALGERPREDHLHQVLVYQHCLEWMARQKRRGGAAFPAGFVDGFDEQPLEGFIILYENKATQRVKEYVVRCGSSEVNRFMEHMRELMDEALEVERTGEFRFCRCKPGARSVLCREITNPGRVAPHRMQVRVPAIAPSPANSTSTSQAGEKISTKKSVGPTEPKQLGGYLVGRRVRHPTFGEGTIMDLKDLFPRRSDIQVTIDFGENGIKKILAGSARLEKL